MIESDFALSRPVERLLPYRAEQLFDLAADVERYPEFLPLWIAARIRSRFAPAAGPRLICINMGHRLAPDNEIHEFRAACAYFILWKVYHHAN